MPFGWFKKKTATTATTTTAATSPVQPQPQFQPAAAPANGHPAAVAARPADAPIPPDKIAARAYEVWVRRGKPHGRDLQNWLDAEAELRAEFAANPEPHAPIRKPR